MAPTGRPRRRAPEPVEVPSPEDVEEDTSTDGDEGQTGDDAKPAPGSTELGT